MVLTRLQPHSRSGSACFHSWRGRNLRDCTTKGTHGLTHTHPAQVGHTTRTHTTHTYHMHIHASCIYTPAPRVLQTTHIYTTHVYIQCVYTLTPHGCDTPHTYTHHTHIHHTCMHTLCIYTHAPRALHTTHIYASYVDTHAKCATLHATPCTCGAHIHTPYPPACTSHAHACHKCAHHAYTSHVTYAHTARARGRGGGNLVLCCPGRGIP